MMAVEHELDRVLARLRALSHPQLDASRRDHNAREGEAALARVRTFLHEYESLLCALREMGVSFDPHEPSRSSPAVLLSYIVRLRSLLRESRRAHAPGIAGVVARSQALVKGILDALDDAQAEGSR